MGRMEEEVIEEFVKRLRADGTIPPSLVDVIGTRLRTRPPKEEALQKIIEDELRNAD